MSGRHSFRELTKGFTPARRRRIGEMKKELLAEMPLHELRRAPWSERRNVQPCQHNTPEGSGAELH